MSLNAEQQRYQKNAIIIAARQATYKALAYKYGVKSVVADVATVITKGTTPKTYGFALVDHGVPFLRAEEVADGEVLFQAARYFVDENTNDFMRRSQTRSGDVLVTIAGTIGRAAVVPPTAPTLNINQAVALIRPKASINPYFFCHMLQALPTQEQIIGSTVTSAISNLSLGKISELSFPCPPSGEQDMIADFLEAVRRRQPWSKSADRLPDHLAEVRRIVSRIEELAAKVEEAGNLRHQAAVETAALLNSIYHELIQGAPRRALREVAPLRRRPVTVELDKSYPQIAVRSFGRGTFHKPPLNGREVTWQKPFIVRRGDILVSNIKAWEGALAVAKEEDDGRVGSHRYLTFVPIEGVATARFVCFHLLTPEGLYDIGEASPGSADRNRTLSSNAFLDILIPVPDYERQLWFDSLCQKVDEVRKVRTEINAELDALMLSILDKAFRGEL